GGQLVDARVEAEGVVGRQRVRLRVIREEDSRLGRGQDADRSLQDAVDDLLQVELGRQRTAHLDQSDQAVELGLDELRGGAGHLASRDRSYLQWPRNASPSHSATTSERILASRSSGFGRPRSSQTLTASRSARLLT